MTEDEPDASTHIQAKHEALTRKNEVEEKAVKTNRLKIKKSKQSKQSKKKINSK